MLKKHFTTETVRRFPKKKEVMEVIIHKKFTDILNKLIDKMSSGESSQNLELLPDRATEIYQHLQEI